MDDHERDELLERVTALEHLLEMGYATWMARMSTAEFSEFERQFEKRMRTSWPLVVEAFGQMVETRDDVIREAQGTAARFWKRARDRERQICQARVDGTLERVGG